MSSLDNNKFNSFSKTMCDLRKSVKEWERNDKMLEIKEVTKIYEMEEVKQVALDKVSINFRKNEFVSILRTKW